ncbi:MAG TPA: radical SAM protein [Candidatus Omnitrophota bacterium]|nr:radical SAM protein [Candidatus Omnitrophota bacterium]
MRLLLFQPPVQDFYDTDIRLQPIGLCYLKAAVKKHLPDVEVIVKDFHQGRGRRTISLPGELKYLEDYYIGPDKSPFSAFHHYYHFGASFEAVADEVSETKPDLVGISSLFSPYYREVLRCAEAVKKKLAAPILIGGPHASAAPLLMLGNSCVDFLIRGEGERPLVEFLRAWTGNREFAEVPNLGFKENGVPVLNKIEPNCPIEEIPRPDFSDLDPGNYCFEKQPMSFIITSRGCPHHCSFCSVHLTFGDRYRKRSVEDIVAEIEARVREGIRVFDFEDDNLTFYISEMKALCKELIKRFSGKDIRLLAMNGISYLSLDPELLELMKRAGFSHLNISLVSTEEGLLRSNRRPYSAEKYVEIVRGAARLGFKTVSYHILGFPGASLESMTETLIRMAQLPVLIGSSPFYLTPHSPIAEKFPPPDEEDIFKSRLTAMAIESEHFKREDIYTLFVTARILNFLKGIQLNGESGTLRDVFEILENSDKRQALGGELLARLLSERKLYAVIRNERRLLPKFKADLFFRIWDKLDFIATQNNQKIYGVTPLFA